MGPIIWDVSPEIFSIGNLTIRYYGVLFASGFYFGQLLMKILVEKEGRDSAFVDSLLWHTMIGTIIGARLGHCLFYEPGYYLSHPIEILKVWQGGLASHGAVLGIIASTYFFRRRHPDLNGWWVFDRLLIAISLAAILIRTGNLMNSEIIGKPTSGTWGFIFTHVDQIPRHPTQLYEAFAYLLTLGALLWMWSTEKIRNSHKILAGGFFVFVFVARIIIEFWKERQVSFEEAMPLDLGQLLSIPAVIFGLWMMYTGWRAGPTREPWKGLAGKLTSGSERKR